MVAIIGKTCVGKTFLLEKAKELGFSTFNSDDFFNNQYKFGEKCYKLIEFEFGKNYVNNKNVDKNMLRKLVLDQNKKNILENLIYPVLFDHLEKNKYDFVEIPILYSKNSNFEKFFNKILRVVTKEETRKKLLKFKNVDNYDFNYFDTINTGICKDNCVDIYMDNISNNMDWKNFFNELLY